MRQISRTEINLIKNFLIEKISPYAIVIFGSAAKGTMRSDSDIDIAFLTDVRLTDYEIFMLAQELANHLGREVDLINLENASTVFQAQIISTGKIIYDTDPNRRMLFQMRALKSYALLNEERQVIVDKLKERGSLFVE